MNKLKKLYRILIIITLLLLVSLMFSGCSKTIWNKKTYDANGNLISQESYERDGANEWSSGKSFTTQISGIGV